jgi:hypothetical protein
MPLRDTATDFALHNPRKGGSIMTNRYEIPEVIEIGRAQDLILGSGKDLPIYDDSPVQDRRTDVMADDE